MKADWSSIDGRFSTKHVHIFCCIFRMIFFISLSHSQIHRELFIKFKLYHFKNCLEFYEKKILKFVFLPINWAFIKLIFVWILVHCNWNKTMQLLDCLSKEINVKIIKKPHHWLKMIDILNQINEYSCWFRFKNVWKFQWKKIYSFCLRWPTKLSSKTNWNCVCIISKPDL